MISPKIYLFLFICLVPLYSSAQTYQWANRIGNSNGDEEIGSLITDKAGNVYVIGGFSAVSTSTQYDTLDLDPGPGTANFIDTNYGASAFLAKYDANGHYIWAKQLGAGILGQSIGLDSLGNIYISGFFYYAPVDFDPGPGVANLSTTGGIGDLDMFIAKYDSNGNYIWAENIGSTSTDERIKVMKVDASGTIYITGFAPNGVIDFDPGSGVANLNFNATILYGAFFAKYASNGDFLWVKSINSTSGNFFFIDAMDIDTAGNIYFTGNVDGSVDADPSVGFANLASAGGSRDVFIAKYNSNGEYLFSEAMGGQANDFGLTINVDGSGSIYLTGKFQAGSSSSSADFDPGPGVANISVLTGGAAIFMAKYDSSGNYIWANSFAGVSDEIRAAVIHQNRIYVVGNLNSPTVDFDPGPGQTFLSSANFQSNWRDVFLAAYDTSGSFNWAGLIGGAGDDYLGDHGFGIPQTILAYHSNNLYLAGQFAGPYAADFDPGPGTAYLTAAGGPHFTDVFIAKYDVCAPDTTVNPQTICQGSFYALNNHTYSAPGSYRDTFLSASGCDSVIVTNLTVNSLDTTVSINNNVLTANAPLATYQWIDCNNGNLEIPGETNQSFTPIANGNYAVVLNQDGCQDTSTCITVTSLGIEHASGQEVKNVLYPNPNSGSFNIYSNGALGKARVKIFNLLGQEFVQQDLPSPYATIRTNLKSGSYLVKIVSESGSEETIAMFIY